MVSDNEIERYEQWKFVLGVKLNAENWGFSIVTVTLVIDKILLARNKEV